jgi:uncharacterized membrane protein YfcA
MTALVVAVVAFLAAGLTFFSGFGLGTLLLPAFSLFYPLPVAIAMTAVVHFLNGLWKLALVGRHVDRRVLLWFGVPALAAAFAGARALLAIGPTKPVIGALLLVFTLFELVPQRAARTVGPPGLALGGVLSGFFGGLSGLQGALRSAFLVRAGLAKEAYVATGAAIGAIVDATRLTVYMPTLDVPVLSVAVLAALAGTALGNRFLGKVTHAMVQRLVAAMLAVFAVLLMLGRL